MQAGLEQTRQNAIISSSSRKQRGVTCGCCDQRGCLAVPTVPQEQAHDDFPASTGFTVSTHVALGRGGDCFHTHLLAATKWPGQCTGEGLQQISHWREHF